MSTVVRMRAILRVRGNQASIMLTQPDACFSLQALFHPFSHLQLARAAVASGLGHRLAQKGY